MAKIICTFSTGYWGLCDGGVIFLFNNQVFFSGNSVLSFGGIEEFNTLFFVIYSTFVVTRVEQEDETFTLPCNTHPVFSCAYMFE